MNEVSMSSTKCNTWFERDRAHVELTTLDESQTIFELWDEAVAEFVEDGFKTSSESWHEAMCNYVNDNF